MSVPRRELTFAWWNLHNFAHYDVDRASQDRWPRSRVLFEAKRDRIVAAIRELFAGGHPDLFAMCEVTREAARELAAALDPGLHTTFAAPYPRDDGFQVAIAFRPGVGAERQPPVFPSDFEHVNAGTRPMAPVHFTSRGHVIRFVACHWTAYDTDTSREARERLADVLRRDCHTFLSPQGGIGRHVVVLGDLNEEPMSRIFESRLIGRRDRASTADRHRTDADKRRVRLYNAAWRYLGEQVPHHADGQAAPGPAGTYFRPPHDWRTFDHVLVSDGLLGLTPPLLDEARTGVASTPVMRDDLGRPKPFVLGEPAGVSDHLPIIGRLIVPGGE